MLAIHRQIKASSSPMNNNAAIAELVPLELANAESKKDTAIANWPSLEKVNSLGFHPETLALVAIPYLVDSVFEGRYRFGAHIVYALAYLRSLSVAHRIKVLEDIDGLGYHSLAKGLKEHYTAALGTQLAWIRSAWADTQLSEEELLSFIRLRDEVVSCARDFRIGNESSDFKDEAILEEIAQHNGLLKVILGLSEIEVVEGL